MLPIRRTRGPLRLCRAGCPETLLSSHSVPLRHSLARVNFQSSIEPNHKCNITILRVPSPWPRKKNASANHRRDFIICALPHCGRHRCSGCPLGQRCHLLIESEPVSCVLGLDMTKKRGDADCCCIGLSTARLQMLLGTVLRPQQKFTNTSV